MSSTTSKDPSAGGAEAGGDGIDRKSVWKRGAFMLLFLAAFGIAQGVQALTALVQFVTLLVTGKPNEFLADFGRGLAMWLAETSGFLTCVTERMPFPFAPWPRLD